VAAVVLSRPGGVLPGPALTLQRFRPWPLPRAAAGWGGRAGGGAQNMLPARAKAWCAATSRPARPWPARPMAP